MPYLSFILAGRDDDYGGDLKSRIQCFLKYLARFSARHHGLCELVVCDWNPLAPDRTMIEGYDWTELESVTIATVGPEIHRRLAGDSNYPILDYIARNVAIRRARGTFVCVLNQDIYPTSGILSFIAERRLDPAYFYRADRCHFVADFRRMADPDLVEDLARSSAFELHRRHTEADDPIDVPVSPEQTPAEWPGSQARRGEIEADTPSMIVEPLEYPPGDNPVEAFAGLHRKGQAQPHEFYRAFGLHTNACGDFIIAPKRAFEDIHGFVETNQFYMHMDSYGLVQLRAAGYRQAIFRVPNVVFHADHDRSGRAGRRESMTLEAHEARWSQILIGAESPRINDSNWGLGDRDIPTVTLRYGKPTPG